MLQPDQGGPTARPGSRTAHRRVRQREGQETRSMAEWVAALRSHIPGAVGRAAHGGCRIGLCACDTAPHAVFPSPVFQRELSSLWAPRGTSAGLPRGADWVWGPGSPVGRGRRSVESRDKHQGGLAEKPASEQRLQGPEESQAGHRRPSRPPQGPESGPAGLEHGGGVG